MVRTYDFAGGKRLTIGEKTCVMGILNVTPDSFSDGGKYTKIDEAKARFKKMLESGIDILDIGAESTRPGAEPLTADEEIARLMPYLTALLPICPVPVSVDTYHAATAQAALSSGADIVNDAEGVEFNGETLKNVAATAAKFNAPLIVTHGGNVDVSRSRDVIADVNDFFVAAQRIAEEVSLPREKLLFDPGLGFAGKTTEQNLVIVKNLGKLKNVNGEEVPLVVGASRKRFIGAVLDLPVAERMEGSLAVAAAVAMAGCEIVRVHDTKETVRVCRMVDAIVRA